MPDDHDEEANVEHVALSDPAVPALDPLAALRDLERALVLGLTANPLESLALLVGTGAALLYWAESGRNEKIRTYWDALHYLATSVSVGYATIFPETPLGKTIGSLAMTIGPALSARALDVTERPAAPGLSPSDAVLAGKLDEILAELRRLGNAR